MPLLLRLLDGMAQDVAYAVRLMRRSPGVTATAVATLAICLGANLAVFAALDAIVLRPLPFPDDGRLVRLFNTYPLAGVPDDGASIVNYFERRGRIAALPQLAEYRHGTAVVGETGATALEQVTRVTPEFFATLGRGPVEGRGFTDDELTPREDAVVVVTGAYARERWGAPAAALGRTVRIDGRPHRVVGVLPPAFRFLSSRARLYLPLASSASDRTGNRHSGSNTEMIGRLAGGASLEAAQAQVDAHNAVVEGDTPQSRAMAAAGFRTRVVPLRADHVAAIRPVAFLLQGGAGLLLLMGVVNLINLLLVRGGGRHAELAVRQAIGASRARVLRQVILEASVLTAAGGVAGAAVGWVGIRGMAALGAGRLPLGGTMAFDGRVAFVGAVACLLLGLAIGAPLAWQALAGSAGPLGGGPRGASSSRRTQRLRGAFLACQVGVALVLLVSAGLLGVSLERAARVAPGFRPEHVLSARVVLPETSYPRGLDLLAVSGRLLDRMAARPGVEAVGLATNVPMSGDTLKSAAAVAGETRRAGEPPHAAYSYGVLGPACEALGVRLMAGRFLTADDSRERRRVAVVDEVFARRHWPEGRALGQLVFQGPEPGAPADGFRIVGIVGAVRQEGLTADAETGAVFYPLAFRLTRTLFLVSRTGGPPEGLSGTLPAVVRQVDPDLPVSDVRTMVARVEGSLLTLRSPAWVAAAFAAVALLLTVIGTYGVISCAVSERRREVGVRMALGAGPVAIQRLFASMGVKLLVVGGVAGLTGSWLAAAALRSVLFEVSPLHLPTLAAATAVLVVVTLAAVFIPARRASQLPAREALAD
ncbi:MAG: ADOP family duplicated permease [Vicinamibacterales bacterium]